MPRTMSDRARLRRLPVMVKACSAPTPSAFSTALRRLPLRCESSEHLVVRQAAHPAPRRGFVALDPALSAASSDVGVAHAPSGRPRRGRRLVPDRCCPRCDHRRSPSIERAQRPQAAQWLGVIKEQRPLVLATSSVFGTGADAAIDLAVLIVTEQKGVGAMARPEF